MGFDVLPLEEYENILKNRGDVPSSVLVCGGAGFMGSNFVKYLLEKYNDIKVVNYDKLTYAGNSENLKNIEADTRYKFVKADIADAETLDTVIKENNIKLIVNFAAETHVDNSIESASPFIQTNIVGTHNLLEEADKHSIRLVQISTDEVFGSTESGEFSENSPLQPNSPYSASKAGADLLCRAYTKTYGTDVIVTHSCNVFGPNQYPEKVIPRFITNLLMDKKVPVYGDGENVREWLYVDDHSKAIDCIIKKGGAGEVYNIGSGFEKSNLDLTYNILHKLGKDKSYIEYVEDRKGHDRRYALKTEKIKSIGWSPEVGFDAGLNKTIEWYRENKEWWQALRNHDDDDKDRNDDNDYDKDQDQDHDHDHDKERNNDNDENRSHDDQDAGGRIQDTIANDYYYDSVHGHYHYYDREKTQGQPKQQVKKALITAGGRGTRLRPITNTRNKHTIPLANRPMIEHAVEKVADAGIEEIGISVNKGEENLQKILGDGSRYGVRITYIEQEGGALGLAHVVKNAKNFINEDSFLFYLGDNIITADLTGFIEEFQKENLNCFLALSRVEQPQRFGVPVIENGKILKVEEKPENPASELAVTGIYIYDHNILEAVDNIELGHRGEFEISDAHTYLINKGLKLGYKEISGWWKDTGKPEDILEGNRILLDALERNIDGHTEEETELEGQIEIKTGASVTGRSIIKGPVSIGKNAKIENSYIGPYTSVGNNTIVKNSEVENSIIMDNSFIEATNKITNSILGAGVTVERASRSFTKGYKVMAEDNSHIEI